ncbi:MAG: LysR family transcriptional regulator [Verrucomicrobia bacterium]|nr:LysR family transcriptional regulator [Verrucomicrobiota bacterium]
MPKKSAGFILRPRFRVERGQDIGLGPGKVELLELIRETGSIAEAAKRMEMSYMRAWTLVKTMEDCFREPLIQVARGGASHGGAHLTEVGEQVVALYRRLEQEASSATADTWRELQKLLRS